MAVDAHQLLHIGGGGAQTAWACWPGDGAATTCYAAPAPAGAQQGRRPCYGAGSREVVVAAARPPAIQQQQQALQFQRSSCAGMSPSPAPAAAPPRVVVAGQQCAAGQQRLCAADVASESGVTFGGAHKAEAAPSRKRRRADDADKQGQAPPVLGIGAADVAAQFRQQMLDVDRLVHQHTARMWAELTEQRRRHAGQVVAAVEAAAAKRMRAKDDEMERVARLNWALEERVRSLYVEAQVWRDLAQSNEAAANALRGQLKQTLDAQQARCAGADDAQSACCGDNGAAAEEDGEVGTSARRGCAACGVGAVEVLLLPCRHLCLCAPCAAEARACPACGCAKNGTISVNFS